VAVNAQSPPGNVGLVRTLVARVANRSGIAPL
jgi:hypothetical protein